MINRNLNRSAISSNINSDKFINKINLDNYNSNIIQTSEKHFANNENENKIYKTHESKFKSYSNINK